MHPILVAACGDDENHAKRWTKLLQDEEIRTSSNWRRARQDKERMLKFSSTFKGYLDELSGIAAPAGACARLCEQDCVLYFVLYFVFCFVLVLLCACAAVHRRCLLCIAERVCVCVCVRERERESVCV